ncbi:hypothetical protein BCR44DRAFT_43784 [Catenaria anguillulae PL171]|uniref:RIIa domain-containing protein n=1 Tax=Catenaria anguillulae PL171 TaxID=765915 RepID=A0A1Y2HT94_9FUNG|nr:hypothetical protein BCR44DRAFT_43784 [Catenaria anguillulae PL171]
MTGVAHLDASASAADKHCQRTRSFRIDISHNPSQRTNRFQCITRMQTTAHNPKHLTLIKNTMITQSMSPHQAVAEAKSKKPALTVDEIHTMQLENERYLRAHPEVTQMTSYFMKRCLLENPRNLAQFASDVFSDPGLKEKVAMSLPAKQPQ